MTDQNNAAQILDAIRAAGYRDHPTNIERKRVDAILLAVEPLLSKLRAPVADERAAFEATVSQWNRSMERQGDGYEDDQIQDAWFIWRKARAALASAPVADERPLGAIINGRTLAERLEAYPFESEGGNLRLCSDWVEFRRCFEYLAEWASALKTQADKDGGQQRAGDGLPEIMRHPEWLRGFADTAEKQAKSYSHGTMYSIAKALREIAGWCEARAALSATQGATDAN